MVLLIRMRTDGSDHVQVNANSNNSKDSCHPKNPFPFITVPKKKHFSSKKKLFAKLNFCWVLLSWRQAYIFLIIKSTHQDLFHKRKKCYRWNHNLEYYRGWQQNSTKIFPVTVYVLLRNTVIPSWAVHSLHFYIEYSIKYTIPPPPPNKN